MPVAYRFRVGDVFTDGTHRWCVDSVIGEKAILRSCSSTWATTIPLTFSEWREGGRWYLEESNRHPADRKVGLMTCQECLTGYPGIEDTGVETPCPLCAEIDAAEARETEPEWVGRDISDVLYERDAVDDAAN